MNALESIVAHDAREACRGEPDLIERIKKAMRSAQNHYMVMDENQQFRGALAAAFLESTEDERLKIITSSRALNKLNTIIIAAQADVRVDIETIETPDPSTIIPLLGLWHQVKAEKAK